VTEWLKTTSNHPIFYTLYSFQSQTMTSSLIGMLILGIPSLQMTNHPWKGRDQIMRPIQTLWAAIISLEWLKLVSMTAVMVNCATSHNVNFALQNPWKCPILRSKSHKFSRDGSHPLRTPPPYILAPSVPLASWLLQLQHLSCVSWNFL